MILHDRNWKIRHDFERLGSLSGLSYSGLTVSSLQFQVSSAAGHLAETSERDARDQYDISLPSSDLSLHGLTLKPLLASLSCRDIKLVEASCFRIVGG